MDLLVPEVSMAFPIKDVAAVLVVYIIQSNQVPEYMDTILVVKLKYQVMAFHVVDFLNKVFHVDRHLRRNLISMRLILHRPSLGLHQLRQSLRRMVQHNLKLKVELDLKFRRRQLLILCWVVELARSLQLE